MTRIQLFLLLGAVVGMATVARTASVDSSSDSDQSDGDADAASVFPGLVSALGAQLGPDAAILGAGDEETEEEDEEPTAPCCFPRVWQGKMVSQIGVAGRRASLVRGVDQVYVDGTNQRLAGDKMDFVGRGKALNFSYILLVRPNRTASLYLFSKSARKCRTQTLKNVVWRPQCIPSNATFRGSLSLGPSAGGLTVQCWTFHVAAKAAAAVDTSARPSPRPPRVFVGGDILVTPGQCIPVVLQEHGVVTRGGPRPQDDVFDDEFNGNDDDDSEDEDKPKPRPSPRPRPKPRPRGEAFAASFFYSNIATSIRDPSVFTPPSYCGKTSNGLFYDDLSEAEEELSTVLDRFLIL